MGEGAVGEVEVVGGAEEEDALAVGEVEGGVGPGGGGAGVAVASVTGEDVSRVYSRFGEEG